MLHRIFGLTTSLKKLTHSYTKDFTGKLSGFKTSTKIHLPLLQAKQAYYMLLDHIYSLWYGGLLHNHIWSSQWCSIWWPCVQTTVLHRSFHCRRICWVDFNPLSCDIMPTEHSEYAWFVLDDIPAGQNHQKSTRRHLMTSQGCPWKDLPGFQFFIPSTSWRQPSSFRVWLDANLIKGCNTVLEFQYSIISLEFWPDKMWHWLKHFCQSSAIAVCSCVSIQPRS